MGMSLSRLSDEELLNGLRSLAARNNDTEAELLLHLGEVDARKLYLDRAHASLFSFCLEELNFSEAVTNNRIVVARLARSFPQVLRPRSMAETERRCYRAPRGWCDGQSGASLVRGARRRAA